MKSVYSAVRTGSLNKAVCAPSSKGLSMFHYTYIILNEGGFEVDVQDVVNDAL
jgi:hypothetical protein